MSYHIKSIIRFMFLMFISSYVYSGASIQYPTAVSLTEGDSITIRGTTSDDTKITRIEVNSVLASSRDGYATWEATVPLKLGDNVIKVLTQDSALNIDPNAASVTVKRQKKLQNPQSIALDSTNNRALIVDTDLGAVLAVNLTTGVRTLISDSSKPNATNAFVNPVDIALDSANNRVLVADNNYPLSAVVAVDLATGERTNLSTTPPLPSFGALSRGFFPQLGSPLGIEVDSANNRALVLDPIAGGLIAVDLSTGERSYISVNWYPSWASLKVPTILIYPQDLVLDSNNNRALVIDSYLDALVAVDLSTGVNTIISNNTTPDTNNAFSGLSSITLDSDNNRVLVTDAELGSVLAVNLSTGARSVIANSSTANASRTLVKPEGIVLDSANNRALLVDPELDAVVTLDLTGSALAVFSGSAIPNATNSLNYPNSIALDSANNRALVTDTGLNALLAVDLSTAARTILNDGTVSPSETRVLDSANNRALSLKGAALVATDLSTGIVTTISDNNTPNANNRFYAPNAIALDSKNNRALVMDNSSLVAVNLNSGERTYITQNGRPSGIGIHKVSSIALDSKNNRMLVVDTVLNAVIAVDLTTGKRTLFSNGSTTSSDRPYLGKQSLTPNADNDFIEPRSITIDSQNNRALVADAGLKAVLAVDLITGERVIFSR